MARLVQRVASCSSKFHIQKGCVEMMGVLDVNKLDLALGEPKRPR